MMLIGGMGDPVLGWTAERIDADVPRRKCPQAYGGLTAVVVVPITLCDDEVGLLATTALSGTYIGFRRAGTSQLGFKSRFERLVLGLNWKNARPGQIHELDGPEEIAPQLTSLARWHGLDGSGQIEGHYPQDVFAKAAHTIAASFADPELMISGTSASTGQDGWLIEAAWFASRLSLRGLLWNSVQHRPSDDAWEEACRIAALSG